MQYRECPWCGAHLDYAEVCDCTRAEKETAPQKRERPKYTIIISCPGQTVKRGGGENV